MEPLIYIPSALLAGLICSPWLSRRVRMEFRLWKRRQDFRATQRSKYTAQNHLILAKERLTIQRK